MWLNLLCKTHASCSASLASLLDSALLPSILLCLEILPSYGLLRSLLNQSEWHIFTVYRKIIPQHLKENQPLCMKHTWDSHGNWAISCGEYVYKEIGKDSWAWICMFRHTVTGPRGLALPEKRSTLWNRSVQYCRPFFIISIILRGQFILFFFVGGIYMETTGRIMITPHGNTGSVQQQWNNFRRNNFLYSPMYRIQYDLNKKQRAKPQIWPTWKIL